MPTPAHSTDAPDSLDQSSESSESPELSWGHRYLMCPPDFYRVDNAINPWMDTTHPIDRDRAHDQWSGLVAALGQAGAKVDLIEARTDSPDMVYSMNLGLVDNDTAILSEMRYPQRHSERATALPWFADHGYQASVIAGGVFEAGDAFLWRDTVLMAHGPRTDLSAHLGLAEQRKVRVTPVGIVDPLMFHLDLSFCPLDARRALVYPDAWDSTSQRTVRDLVPEPLVLSRDEALLFCANSIVVGRTVIMPSCPPRIGQQLATWGFDVVEVPLSELHLGGGSARCLTLPLDTNLDPARVSPSPLP
jgi:N-dimethylarginine dimethylaminohydrolase